MSCRRTLCLSIFVSRGGFPGSLKSVFSPPLAHPHYHHHHHLLPYPHPRGKYCTYVNPLRNPMVNLRQHISSAFFLIILGSWESEEAAEPG